MTGPVAFTDNYRDLSNAEGYQFEFRCERGGNGYRSAYRRSMRNTGGTLMRGLGNMLGGAAADLARSAEQFLDRGTNSQEKDAALRTAVDEITPHFTQCHGCGEWVCEAVCWNNETGQCVRCSPVVAEELVQLQAAARRQQLRDALQDALLIGDIPLSGKAVARCPQCDAQSSGGTFCGRCGSPLVSTVRCAGCNADNSAGARFCVHCGTGLT